MQAMTGVPKSLNRAKDCLPAQSKCLSFFGSHRGQFTKVRSGSKSSVPGARKQYHPDGFVATQFLTRLIEFVQRVGVERIQNLSKPIERDDSQGGGRFLITNVCVFHARTSSNRVLRSA